MAYLFGKTISKDDFINTFGKEAVKRYEKEKVLPSLVICQAILESGWGNSDIAVKFGNYLGMNYYNDSVTHKYDHDKYITKQFMNGKYVEVIEEFCKFDNIYDMLDCYYSWLHRDKPCYRKIHECTLATDNFKYIKEAGYATAPNYPEALERIYEQYPLIKQYDDIVVQPQKTEFYYIQIGAFYQKTYAKKYVQYTREKGFTSFIRLEDGLYKVQLGAYLTEHNAHKVLEKLKAEGFKAFIFTGTNEGEYI